MLFDEKFGCFQCVGIKLTVMLIRSQDGSVLIQTTAVFIYYEKIEIYIICMPVTTKENSILAYSTQNSKYKPFWETFRNI